ncbi:hypothetical protein MCEMSE15_02006 [Fimbriimonadaceae bacterium]
MFYIKNINWVNISQVFGYFFTSVTAVCCLWPLLIWFVPGISDLALQIKFGVQEPGEVGAATRLVGFLSSAGICAMTARCAWSLRDYCLEVSEERWFSERAVLAQRRAAFWFAALAPVLLMHRWFTAEKLAQMLGAEVGKMLPVFWVSAIFLLIVAIGLWFLSGISHRAAALHSEMEGFI